MKITKNSRVRIVDKFCGGASIAEIADWFDQPKARIEGVIREALRAEMKAVIELATKAACGVE